MTIKHQVAKTVNKLLNFFGVRLVRLSKHPYDPLSLSASLERLVKRGVEPATVIDVGASDGRWTKTVKRFYPNARFHLIEANNYHEKKLIEFVRNNKECSYKLAVAADKVGKIFFDDSNPFGGVAHSEDRDHQFIQISSTTVDDEVSLNKLKGPFLLKLDTHGFEVPIFNGARNSLMETIAIVVETYNFDLSEDSLKFWEMCDFLFQLGFRPIDFMEPMFRPKDNALWQMDLVFIRANSEEFQDNKYD